MDGGAGLAGDGGGGDAERARDCGAYQDVHPGCKLSYPGVVARPAAPGLRRRGAAGPPLPAAAHLDRRDPRDARHAALPAQVEESTAVAAIQAEHVPDDGAQPLRPETRRVPATEDAAASAASTHLLARVG